MHQRIRTALCTTALAIGLALPAAADHTNRSRPWWDRNVSRECAEPEPAHWRHRHPSHRYRHRHGHTQHRQSYHCGPCRRRYRDYDAFERHLGHHHRVPIWRIPQVIFEATFGWIFYG